jgi:hypothetical protein
VLILDSNVLSELLRPAPESAVIDWFRKQRLTDLFTTAITEAELRLGSRLLPGGRRRQALVAAIDLLFDEQLADQVLPFDRAAARHYADVVAARRALGRPVTHEDAQIGAIALAHGAVLATRNTRDFDSVGVTLVDPFAA